MPSRSKGLHEPPSAFRGVCCFDCKQIERDAEDYDHWTFFVADDGYYRFRCRDCSEQSRRHALVADAPLLPSP